MITPFTTRFKYTVIGKVDVGLMAVFLALNASIVSSANFLVTYRYLSTLNNKKMIRFGDRAPGPGERES